MTLVMDDLLAILNDEKILEDYSETQEADVRVCRTF
jgi:hypothetical protein